MELVERLMRECGVNERQAKGGIGAVLFLVKDQVSSGIFEDVVQLIPDADAWMALSPEGRNSGFFSTLDNVFKSVAGGNLAVGARLGGHFHSLGISTKLVAPFTKEVLTYLHQNLKGRAQAEIDTLLDHFRA